MLVLVDELDTGSEGTPSIAVEKVEALPARLKKYEESFSMQKLL